MKKSLLFLVLLVIAQFKAEAQCTVAVQSISEDFDGYTGNDLPNCWNRQNNCYVVTDQLRLRTVNAAEAMAILPKTVNTCGVLSFVSRYIYPWGPSGTIEVGVVSDPAAPASFVVLGSFSASSQNLTPFSFDFSAYAGSYQYIAIRMAANTAWEVYFDNLTYTSGCVSASVTAVAQNFTAQLGSNGQVAITAADINNGSSSDCGAPALALSKTDFDCNDIGVTQVTLTATDISGNTSTATANVTILAAIDNETVTATSSSFCPGGSTTVTTGSSASGVNYYLRNNSDDSVVDGPLVGDGNALSFNTGTLTSTTTFNVYAATIGTVPSIAVDLDGVNDYLTATVATGLNYAQGYTFESWVKTSLPGSGGSRAIFSAGTTAISDIEVYVQGSSNKVYIVYNRNNPSATLTYYEYPTPVANTWFHMAISYDGSTTKVYYNGVLQSASASQNGSPLAKTTNSTFEFGRAQVSVSHPEYGFLTLLGSLDETRIWNIARTQPEIAAMMNICAAGTEAGLKQCYSFEDGTGLATTNIIGGNNATLVNMSSPEDWITGPIGCPAPPDPICAVEMTQTVTVTVGDALAPVADVASLTAINAQCEVTSLTAPTATDNCAGAITGTHNASLPITSSTTITWTYHDGNGNSATQSQNVVVNDNTAPVADAGSLANVTAQCEVTSLSAPTATDNCAGSIAGTHNASLPLSASTTVTWTYDDGNGNSVTQTQEVVIEDNTAPVPDAVSLPQLTGVCEITALTAPTATDNCAGSLTATHDATLPLTSNQIITWTWNDGDLNSVTQTQNVVISDVDVSVSQNGGTLTADLAGAAYQWVDCDNGNAPINGAENQDFMPTASGNYAVEVTLDGCTETSVCINMMVTSIGQANASDVRIFPIPATDVLNIVSNLLIEEALVYSMDGKLMKSYSQNTKAIDVSQFASGMYLLIVKSEDGISQSRFVKE